MPELSPQQRVALENIVAQGFRLAAVPLYANAIVVCRGNCAALLQPSETGGLGLVGGPCYLVDGNLSVRLTRSGRHWFVWKKRRVEATPARLAELDSFTRELAGLLSSTG